MSPDDGHGMGRSGTKEGLVAAAIRAPSLDPRRPHGEGPCADAVLFGAARPEVGSVPYDVRPERACCAPQASRSTPTSDRGDLSGAGRRLRAKRELVEGATYHPARVTAASIPRAEDHPDLGNGRSAPSTPSYDTTRSSASAVPSTCAQAQEQVTSMEKRNV